MNLERDQFDVHYDSKKTSPEQLLKTAADAGFPAEVVTKQSPEAKPPVKVGELPDFYREAVGRARRENKPLVLDFGTSWCIPCKRLDKETLADPKVSRLLSKCVFLKVDTDKSPAVAKHFGVVGMPDLRLVLPNGETYRKFVGFQSAGVLEEALRGVIEEVASNENSNYDSRCLTHRLEPVRQIDEAKRVYSNRTVGGDCDYHRPNRSVAPRCPESTRSCGSRSLDE